MPRKAGFSDTWMRQSPPIGLTIPVIRACARLGWPPESLMESGRGHRKRPRSHPRCSWCRTGVRVVSGSVQRVWGSRLTPLPCPLVRQSPEISFPLANFFSGFFSRLMVQEPGTVGAAPVRPECWRQRKPHHAGHGAAFPGPYTRAGRLRSSSAPAKCPLSWAGSRTPGSGTAG